MNSASNSRSVVFRVVAGILAFAGGIIVGVPLIGRLLGHPASPDDSGLGILGSILVITLAGYAVFGERAAYKVLSLFGVKDPATPRSRV